jgi:galactokinase/mevalonate kinase-like predicted kinase
MAAPLTAPTIENLSSQGLVKQIAELQAEIKLLWQAIERQGGDIADHGRRIKAQEAQPKAATSTAQIHERRLKNVDALLMSHNNQPISFADMGKLLGYKKETRRQNMTKLGNSFKQYPDRYEVRDSKLGGKIVRLVPAYLNHLLKGGV